VTVQTPAKVPIEILKDRMTCIEEKEDGVMSRAFLNLSNALNRIVVRTARYDDDQAVPGSGQITDELLDLIRETIVRRVDELGLAR
jgi:hypothetical protein